MMLVVTDKIRGIDGRRAKRTIAKEKLYKHIRGRICELRPNFNIGVNTGIEKMSDRWEQPYRHWSFVSSNSTINEDAQIKHPHKENSPVQPT